MAWSIEIERASSYHDTRSNTSNNNAVGVILLTRYCFVAQKHCKKAKERVWIHYKPSLFQHIGTHSSLKGKVQKLKVSNTAEGEATLLNVRQHC